VRDEDDSEVAQPLAQRFSAAGACRWPRQRAAQRDGGAAERARALIATPASAQPARGHSSHSANAMRRLAVLPSA
jgi:hypothetical protein